MGVLPILTIGLDMSTLILITHNISMTCLLLTTHNWQLTTAKSSQDFAHRLFLWQSVIPSVAGRRSPHRRCRVGRWTDQVWSLAKATCTGGCQTADLFGYQYAHLPRCCVRRFLHNGGTAYAGTFGARRTPATSLTSPSYCSHSCHSRSD